MICDLSQVIGEDGVAPLVMEARFYFGPSTASLARNGQIVLCEFMYIFEVYHGIRLVNNKTSKRAVREIHQTGQLLSV